MFYSAPSRLVGQRLRVHLFDDRVTAFLGSTQVVSHPRIQGRRGTRQHVVDYRHIIHTLRRKPQALARSIYRDALFPGSAYRQAWQAFSTVLDERDACRRMVDLPVCRAIGPKIRHGEPDLRRCAPAGGDLLVLAHDEACETELAALIDDDLAAGNLPDPAALRARIERRHHRHALVDVPVELTALGSFDRLLEGPGCRSEAPKVGLVMPDLPREARADREGRL